MDVGNKFGSSMIQNKIVDRNPGGIGILYSFEVDSVPIREDYATKLLKDKSRRREIICNLGYCSLG